METHEQAQQKQYTEQQLTGVQRQVQQCEERLRSAELAHSQERRRGTCLVADLANTVRRDADYRTDYNLRPSHAREPWNTAFSGAYLQALQRTSAQQDALQQRAVSVGEAQRALHLARTLLMQQQESLTGALARRRSYIRLNGFR